MVGYGSSFGSNCPDTRALVFENDRTKMSYAGRVTIDDRPALRYDI
jgi:hypothetical protein